MVDPTLIAPRRFDDRLDLEELYSPESPPPEMDRELLEMVEFLENNLPPELSNSSDVENDFLENSNESSNTSPTTEPNDERSWICSFSERLEDSLPEFSEKSEKIDESTRTTTTNFFRDDLIARVRLLSNSRIDALYDNIVYHSDFSRYNNGRK